MNRLAWQVSLPLLGSVSVLALAIAAVALVLVSSGRSWRLLRTVVTIAHEGGHAVVALLSGRKLNGIRLHSDTSGLTVSTGRASGPGMVFTLFAGYPAVSLLGLAGAWLVTTDRVRLMLWIAVGLLVLMLIALRNVYGIVSVVVTGGLVFAISWFATPTVQALSCGLMSWFLLFGGIRPITELSSKRRRGRAQDSDADQLARLARVPAPLWLLIWLAIGVGCLLLGGHWLLVRS